MQPFIIIIIILSVLWIGTNFYRIQSRILVTQKDPIRITDITVIVYKPVYVDPGASHVVFDPGNRVQFQSV